MRRLRHRSYAVQMHFNYWTLWKLNSRRRVTRSLRRWLSTGFRSKKVRTNRHLLRREPLHAATCSTVQVHTALYSSAANTFHYSLQIPKNFLKTFLNGKIRVRLITISIITFLYTFLTLPLEFVPFALFCQQLSD